MSQAQETPKDAARRLAASAIRKGYKPQALHEYADQTGAPIYWRIRLKHPDTDEKWIRPMRRDGEGFALGELEFPEGKPLYRLHNLAQHPGEEVMVTEGEWCADALAKAGILATTSGAADSAGKADWSPLAGRSVTIWPDQDEAGNRYAEAVKCALEGIGCTVRLIDVQALNLPPKGDAVDWLEAHPGATAADILALPTVTPREEPRDDEPELPDHFQYGGGRFEVSAQGVFHIGTDKDGNELSPRWISSRLDVTAKTRDSGSKAWGRLLEWRDDDGILHRWAMPMEMLQGDGGEVRRELANQGLSIAPGRAARELLASFLQVWPVEDRARCVDRLGWHGDVFVTPSESKGDSGEIVVFQNAHSIEPALAEKGSVSAWRDTVARLAAGNSRLTFALSVAFAGPLADIAGEDSGGFHLRGISSSGKSTALYLASSVWGDPVAYRRLWRATANGLEGLAALHNDGVLILDELAQIDAREAGEAAYLLANGQGKARASRTGTARQSARWRLLFLSAGEIGLAQHMSEAGKTTRAGQEIRLAEIESDAGAGIGAFETLHEYGAPAAFALALKDAALVTHGAAGVEWLRHIVADRSRLADLIRTGIADFVTESTPKDAAGQVFRVARRFGLVAVAGELATHYGLTGWKDGDASEAVKKCFISWLEAFGGTGNREDRALFAQVRAFFEAHGASRFEDVNSTREQRVMNRAGFYRFDDEGQREFLVLTEAFKEVTHGFEVKAAARILADAGWIEPGKDGKTSQKPRIPGMGPTRCYVFTSKIWEGDE